MTQKTASTKNTTEAQEIQLTDLEAQNDVSGGVGASTNDDELVAAPIPGGGPSPKPKGPSKATPVKRGGGKFKSLGE